jgi:hypothetical protein
MDVDKSKDKEKLLPKNTYFAKRSLHWKIASTVHLAIFGTINYIFARKLNSSKFNENIQENIKLFI